MADNEKTTGVPIEDEALDNVAGGIALTPDTAYDVHLLQPIDNFNEACESINSTLDRQNNPNNYYTEPSTGDIMTDDDRLSESFKNYLGNLNRR